ncbi:bifunctional DNA primase/polymerase [Rhizobium jaguaris]|uniref:bifunctional DNA primase/polymerase n=1 Tax=Rhizobium jaguaris TaxID=1312183 RepID=UPI0039BFBED8
MSNSINTTESSRKQGEVLKEAWLHAEDFPIKSNPIQWKIAVWGACQCSTQLEAALVYAEAGIPVLPCNWKPNDTGKVQKCPMLGEGGLYQATIDLDQICKWWAKWPDALIGCPMGRRVGVWVVDADSMEGHGVDGLGNWWELAGSYNDPGKTRAHKTGSEGLHFLYKWDDQQPVGCPTSTVPPGIEIKGEGGYIILPPSPYLLNGEMVSYGTSDDMEPVAAPAWLYEKVLGPRAKSRGMNGHTFEWSEGFGQKKLDEICKVVRSATTGHWDEARRKVFLFGRLVGGGAYNADKAWEELEQAARECRAPDDYVSETKRAFENGVADPTSPFMGEEVQLSDFRAYLPQHQYIFIPTRELWPAASVNSRIPSVDNKVKASAWLDQHRSVEQMTWAPGEPMLINNRLMAEGGWIEKQGVTCFNLYRGPSLTGGAANKAGPWVEHVCRVFGDDAEHLFKWFAHRVQFPGVKINHALVLGSENQGTGKDTMLEPVKRAVGPWNFQEGSPQQVLGRFNGFLKSVILRINEARDLGEVNRYQFYDHTKAYTASPPDVLRIDEKHLNEYSIVNCVGLIITTNYKFTGIYLPPEDRRHYVAWNNLSPGDFEAGYWNTLWGWYADGGYEHVAAFLAEYNISDFDPKAPPPKTQAFWDIVEANRAPQESQMADLVDQLDHPAVLTFQDLVNAASPSFGDWLEDAKNRKVASVRLFECGYEPVRNPDVQAGLWKVCGTRMMVYALKTMSTREKILAVEEYIRGKVPPKHVQ